jgi:hypothetical protein
MATKKHPKVMGKSEIEAFLGHLANNRKVAASTQRQALNALVFLYKHVKVVLHQPGHELKNKAIFSIHP